MSIGKNKMKVPKPVEFVKEQHEEGVEKKLKGVSNTSLWKVHKVK